MFYTKRLMLRALDLETDLIALLKLENEVEFRWSASAEMPRPSTRETVKSNVENRLKKETGLPLFAICERPQEMPDTLASSEDLFSKNGAPRYPLIGILNFHHVRSMSFTNRVSSFGIAFDQSNRGKGYGTEIIAWMLEYAFKGLGLHKMKLTVSASNARAIKCYEKAGFQHEGRFREEYFKNGKWEDSLAMGILRSEWLEGQPE